MVWACWGTYSSGKLDRQFAHFYGESYIKKVIKLTWGEKDVELSEEDAIRKQTRQLEERAILGEISSVFAHEVRNPVNNIVGGALCPLVAVKMHAHFSFF